MQQDIKDLAEEVLNNTRSGLMRIAVEGSVKYAEVVEKYVGDAQDRFSALFQHIAEGGSYSFFFDRLAEEKDILKSIILSFAVIGKGIASEMINSLYEIILSALDRSLIKLG